MGRLTLTMECNKGSSSLALGIHAASSASNATMYVEFNAGAFSEGEGIPSTGGAADAFAQIETSFGQSGAGELVYRDSTTTIAMPFGYAINRVSGSECKVSGVALQS
jgi:hypothetical protein